MSKLDEKLKRLAGDHVSKPAKAGKGQAVNVPRDARGRILPGHSLNPAGAKKGKPHYMTEMMEGIKKLAKENKMSVAELLVRMYAKGFKLGMDGDYQFYRDFMDRRHGKPIQPLGGPEDEDGNDTPISIKIDI